MSQGAVTIRRIRDPEDDDVRPVLQLYERRIPASERDEPERLIRSLRTARGEAEQGAPRLMDYFLVAHVDEELAGFAYVQLYPSTSLAFFSYLVIDDTVPDARHGRVSVELARHIRHLLIESGQCSAVVLEAEEPDALTGDRAAVAAARIRHFQALAHMAGWPLHSLPIPYVQPRLTRRQPRDAEVPMRLLYSPLDVEREPRLLRKNDIAHILDFLAHYVYADHGEDGSDLARAYRAYLDDWKTRILQAVPDVVELT